MSIIDADQWDRQRRVAGWSQNAVESASCAVLGAGALGNEVVKNLVQLGVREISVVDFDTVVAANLNRCVFFTHEDARLKRNKARAVAREALRINPSAKIIPVEKRVEELEEGFFSKHAFVFSCLDNLGARLHANALCYGNSVMIDGGTTGFSGKVQVSVSPGPCLECAISRQDYNLMWKKYSCTGEMLEFVDPKMPAIATTTSVIAAVQANEFVKLAHKRQSGDERAFAFPALDLTGRYLFYNGLTGESKVFKLDKRANCPVHA